jgi:hypothetical protein
LTLAIGAAVIVLAQALLAIDVMQRGGAIVPREPLPDPSGSLRMATRWIAINMTPVCWIGYLLLVDGLLERVRVGPGSPMRRRPGVFVVCVLASVPIWLFFDWVNFSFLDAWRYHELPESIVHRYMGYFVSFGAICPAMFMTAILFMRLGLHRWRTGGLRLDRALLAGLFCAGLVLFAIPFVVRAPVSSMAIWLSPILVLDPVNHVIGAPSIVGDWKAGRWGRTAALMAGGATCGLLWEFWNYWAVAKWTYNLPFLGPWEAYRYFEMPLIGFLGFLPFGVACWVMFQSILAGLRRIGLAGAALPAGEDVIL